MKLPTDREKMLNYAEALGAYLDGYLVQCLFKDCVGKIFWINWDQDYFPSFDLWLDFRVKPTTEKLEYRLALVKSITGKAILAVEKHYQKATEESLDFIEWKSDPLIFEVSDE